MNISTNQHFMKLNTIGTHFSIIEDKKSTITIMYTYMEFVMYAQIIWLSFLYVKSSVIAKFTEVKVEQAVEVINLSKSYILDKKELKVLENINLKVTAGNLISIIGPSGCGKSTLFRVIAGLEKDYTGSVYVNGSDIANTKPYIAYMLQKDLLLPWRNVWKNVVLPLELAGTLKDTDNTFLEKMLEEFGLKEFKNAYPDELSGGMRQRVALLRTWLMKGSVMLLDEPFGALDALTRNHMQDWLTKVWEKHQKTVLFITHDIEEAIYLSDEIVVMSQRPGKFIESLNIDLERPRKRDMVYTQQFVEYKKRIMSKVQE